MGKLFHHNGNRTLRPRRKQRVSMQQKLKVSDPRIWKCLNIYLY